MTIKTKEATGHVLDWMVAKCEGIPIGWNIEGDFAKIQLLSKGHPPYSPSTDWAQGGPIKQREEIVDGIVPQDAGAPIEWLAFKYRDAEHCRDGARSYGPTPLIAAMRCYVASKLGDEVEVPEELL
jgi:hypothetical protein